MSYRHQIKKIVQSSGVYAGTNIFTSAVAFLMLPVLTRFLTPLDYGILATFQAIYMLGESFVDMGSNTAIFRRYFGVHEGHSGLPQYIFNSVVVKLFFLALFFALLFSLHGILGQKFYFPSWLILVIPVTAFASAFIKIITNLWVAQKKAYRYCIFECIRALIEVALSLCLVVLAGLGWKGSVLGIALTEGVFMLFCLFLLLRARFLTYKIDSALVKDILWFGVPLFIYGIGRWAINLVDRFFLNTMLSVSVTGIYSVGYGMASVIEFIAGGIGLAIMPILFERLKSPTQAQKNTIVKYIYIYFAGLLGITMLWIICAPYFLKIFVGERFVGACLYIPLVSMAYFANAMFKIFSLFITYAKKTYYLTYAVVVSAVVNLILNYFLIKANGAIGAAQSTLIAFLVNLTLTWVFAQRVYPMPWFGWVKRHGYLK